MIPAASGACGCGFDRIAEFPGNSRRPNFQLPRDYMPFMLIEDGEMDDTVSN